MTIVLAKIALLISIYFPPDFGGGATGAWNRAMVLQKNGYSVYVISGLPSYPSGKVSNPNYKGKFFHVETIGSFRVIRLRLLPLSHISIIGRTLVSLHFVLITILFLPRILRLIGRIDLVYARAPILFSSLNGFVFSKIAKSLFIFEAPDLWPEELVDIKTRLAPLITRVGRILARFSYTAPDVVVTVSKSAAEHIRTHYQTARPVFGIPVGADVKRFQGIPKEKSRKELIGMGILPPALNSKFIILFAGLISAAQRVEDLAEAAKILRNDEAIAFLIVGEGNMKGAIEHIKMQHDLRNLYLLPSQPRDMMPKIIAAVDVCTVLLSDSSIFNIALPIKFYEYLASGKPILGVCGGELAEIIESDKIGVVVQAGDVGRLASAIDSLKQSQQAMHEMQENCKLTLERFSLDAIAKEFVDVLALEH